LTAAGAVHPRGARVENAVLDAAIAAVVEHGTIRVSMEEIADRAGVNKTTVYRRWPGVEEILLAAVTRHAEETIPIPDTGDLAEDLRRLSRMVRDAISTPTARALLVAARANSDGALGRVREQFWAQRLGLAATIVMRGVERGQCPPVDSPEQVIEHLVGPIHFRLNELGRPVDDAYLEELVAGVLRALGRLVASRPAGRAANSGSSPGRRRTPPGPAAPGPR